MADLDSVVVSYVVKENFAIITLNNPAKLNALTRRQWFRLASVMDEIDTIPEVVITLLTGTGRFFSA
jgi:Delta3-Delta2-enoyl-CoA isomerase